MLTPSRSVQADNHNDVPTLCSASFPGHRMVGPPATLKGLSVGRISPLSASPSHQTSSWPESGGICLFPITWPGLWLWAFFRMGSTRTEGLVLLAEVLPVLTGSYHVVGVQLIFV